MKMIEWTIKIRVADMWVADGYELDVDATKEALMEYSLGYATYDEIEIEIVDAPKQEIIIDLQTFGPYDEREE